MTPHEAIDWLKRNTEVMRTDYGAFVIAILLDAHRPRTYLCKTGELITSDRAEFPKMIGGWF